MATPRKTAVATRNATQVALPAEIEAALKADVAKFQERLAVPTGNKISITQDRKFRNPAGDKYDSVQGVIVDFISKKAYYGGRVYDAENITPPDCFALDFVPHDSLIPSENSPKRQADDCKTCPLNAFKSAANGKGKACKESYVLALLPPDADATSELMTLELSATAIKSFEKYVRDVARDFGPAYSVVTTFVMDDTVDYPSVRCIDAVRADNALIALAYNRREDAAKLLAVEPDVSGYEEAVAPKAKQRLVAAKPAAQPRRVATR